MTVGRSEKMSKSKKNVVGLEAIVEGFGADTARLFLLSDSPPERDLEWTDGGAEGVWRFINRVWRMVTESPVALPPAGAARPDAIDPAGDAALRLVHKTIQAVTEDLEGFRFNKAVARIRELVNGLGELDPALPGAPWVLRQGCEAAAQLLCPMTPHLSEELWKELGHAALLVDTPWPQADAALLVDDMVTLAVQVNGKLRGTLDMPRDADRALIERAALELPAVIRFAEGKPPRKVVVVPNRIVNVVV